MTRRNRPANRFGCKPTEDVCVQHDEPLLCKHGCGEAKQHGCLSEENWNKVEWLVLKSFTGGALTEAEQLFLNTAYETNKKEYAVRSQAIRLEEIERRKRNGI